MSAVVSAAVVIERIEVLVSHLIETIGSDTVNIPTLLALSFDDDDPFNISSSDSDDDPPSSSPPPQSKPQNNKTNKNANKYYTGPFRKRMTKDGSKSFVSVLLVLDFVHSLLMAKKTTTVREVYYRYVTHFRNQPECDTAIFEAARLLNVERGSLGIFASPKGWICGKLTMTTSSVTSRYDSLPSIQGTPITSEWLTSSAPTLKRGDDQMLEEGRAYFESDARVIIVVEKEGVYMRLSEDRFFDKLDCIVVTGKGIPDLATRACVKILSTELDIPVLGLCDCNPYGLQVLLTYRKGGTARSTRDASFMASNTQWLGLRPSQAVRLAEDGKLPNSVFQQLTARDISKISSLMKVPYIKSSQQYNDELEQMLESGWKMELEALSWVGVDYLSEEWLLQTILNGDYI
ncbi:hypothetical protein TrLO_g14842 [Triparma laevis f. longispina]|uniref:DNA topoisomerase (ATP-hydrolyzing) n=1 Tax=Triparma laevis f. longispina TaxID=1714387 RepID=A0A9W7FRL5_9STRA|nr:hypothetical protein TrLO_g14842 [Triparma laevis f. longispina]